MKEILEKYCKLEKNNLYIYSDVFYFYLNGFTGNETCMNIYHKNIKEMWLFRHTFYNSEKLEMFFKSLE